MNKIFAARLLERVLVTFAIGFVSTYVNVLLGGIDTTGAPGVGQIGILLKELEGLSLAHKAVAAGGMALFQLAVSVFIAPHIGDPNSPDLVPKRFLKQGEHSAATVAKYAASDELQNLLQSTAASNPNVPLTVENVLAQVAQATVSRPPDPGAQKSATPAT